MLHRSIYILDTIKVKNNIKRIYKNISKIINSNISHKEFILVLIVSFILFPFIYIATACENLESMNHFVCLSISVCECKIQGLSGVH